MNPFMKATKSQLLLLLSSQFKSLFYMILRHIMSYSLVYLAITIHFLTNLELVEVMMAVIYH
jgi:hypothetical protein